jgi:hypothetical protein
MHLIDVVAIVQFTTLEYRLMWLEPGKSGLSYFAANLAVALLLAGLFLALAVAAFRKHRLLRPALTPLLFLMFTVLFSYRLYFLHANTLDDQWYQTVTRDEPWDGGRLYLGLILELRADDRALVKIENGEVAEVDLPTSNGRTQVLIVEKQRTRFSGQHRYVSDFYFEYDDLELALREYAPVLLSDN